MSKLKKLGIDPFAKANLSWIQDTREEIIPQGIKLSPIEFIKPDKLKINPLNAEYFSVQGVDEYESLKADIKARGIIVPLIAKRDLMLLTGETRLRIALELNLKVVPVQFVDEDLSLEEERGFLVKDNLRRRQLSPEQKEALILKLYPNEIKLDKRGGDRKSGSKIKSSSEPLISLPKKIESETGIPEGTAKRILARIRKGKVEQKGTELKDLKKDLYKLVEKIKSSENPDFISSFIKEMDVVRKELKTLLQNK